MLALRDDCIHPTTKKPYILESSGGRDNSPEGHQVVNSPAYTHFFSSISITRLSYVMEPGWDVCPGLWERMIEYDIYRNSSVTNPMGFRTRKKTNMTCIRNWIWQDLSDTAHLILSRKKGLCFPHYSKEGVVDSWSTTVSGVFRTPNTNTAATTFAYQQLNW